MQFIWLLVHSRLFLAAYLFFDVFAKIFLSGDLGTCMDSRFQITLITCSCSVVISFVYVMVSYCYVFMKLSCNRIGKSKNWRSLDTFYAK